MPMTIEKKGTNLNKTEKEVSLEKLELMEIFYEYYSN